MPDQSLRPFVESIEVVRGVKRLTGPIVAKPPHISLDGVDILLLFLGRIGVVEAQVAVARKFLRNAEIERDRLSVADMEVAVRFRRESGHDLFVFAGSEIRGDEVANKVAPFLCRRRFCRRHLNVPAEPIGPSAKFAFLGQAPPATLVKAAKSLARTRSRNAFPEAAVIDPCQKGPRGVCGNASSASCCQGSGGRGDRGARQCVDCPRSLH